MQFDATCCAFVKVHLLKMLIFWQSMINFIELTNKRSRP